MFFGDFLQDNIVLCFGSPSTAVFAHLDTVGFMTRYENQLVAIGGPEVVGGDVLTGQDDWGPIRCKAIVSDEGLFHDFQRSIMPGTILAYEQADVIFKDGLAQAAFLDNRLGIYNALKLCETLENGIVVFSTYEEHGGGSIPMLVKFIYEKWGIKNALISDVTWATEGVRQGEGVVISVRDASIPRRSFINKIVGLATQSGIRFQLEVEDYGSSDGREIHHAPYPVDWCFIGVPVEDVHTCKEKVVLEDLHAMMDLYRYLMHEL